MDDVQEGMKNMMSAEAAAAAPKIELSEEAKAATNSAQTRFHEAAANPEMAAGSPGGGGHEARPGDWPCPNCNANCFASRTECFKCGTPKPM